MMHISETELHRANRSVGVVVAMRQEFDAIRQVLIPEAAVVMQQYSQVAVATSAGINYIVLQSGVGTTNAAIGTCDLLQHHRPDWVFNLGTAALIRDPTSELCIADVLVGERHCQWDLDLGGPITAEWTGKRSFVDVLQTSCLYPDALLLRAAEGLTGRQDLRLGFAHFFSGNSFFVSDAQHDVLPRPSAVMAVDMESFAVAQVCARKAVPFLCIRGITDTGTASANQDFSANVKAASQAAAELAQQLVKSLPIEEEPTNAKEEH